MSTKVTVCTGIAAPAELVWDLVTDWTGQGTWMPGTFVRVTEGDGGSVGSRLVAFTGVGDIGVLDYLEIVELEPPRRCVVRHLGKLMRGTGEFTVRPLGDGTAELTWSERLDPPFGPIGRIGLPIVAPLLRLGMRRAVSRLAANCVRQLGALP